MVVAGQGEEEVAGTVLVRAAVAPTAAAVAKVVMRVANQEMVPAVRAMSVVEVARAEMEATVAASKRRPSHSS